MSDALINLIGALLLGFLSLLLIWKAEKAAILVSSYYKRIARILPSSTITQEGLEVRQETVVLFRILAFILAIMALAGAIINFRLLLN